MDDLLVVGVDLQTNCTVYVGDHPKHVLKAKGHGGDGTLVCLDCFLGDGVPAGTRVPLLYRGRAHGKRRPHFAHPPGQGPVGGHRPETPWHADAKKTLAAWARQRPQVADVNVERWTADGRRRSDVAVVFIDGTRLAIEIQQHGSRTTRGSTGTATMPGRACWMCGSGTPASGLRGSRSTSRNATGSSTSGSTTSAYRLPNHTTNARPTTSGLPSTIRHARATTYGLSGAPGHRSSCPAWGFGHRASWIGLLPRGDRR